MKILHLTPAYKPAYVYGGPTMSVARLCEALSDEEIQQDIEIEVFCTKANGQAELPIPSGISQIVDGVKVTYFNRITKDHTHFSPALLWALWKKINKEKKQYPKGEFQVHLHSWWNLVVLFGALITKIQGIPMVFSPRGMITDYTQNHNNSLIKSLIHKAFGKKLLKSMYVVASSEKELQDYMKVCPPLQAQVIPNIVDLPQQMPAKPNIDSPLFKLLFLSRVEQKKGLDLLIKALAQVNLSWSLTIAGSGEDYYIQQLKEQIQSLGLTTKIHWIGHQNNEQKFDVLATHDLLCLTSYNENFANVVIESLAVGTPVLLSDQVGLAGYIKENNLGYICELETSSMVEQLETAYHDSDNRKRIEKLAPAKVQADFQAKNLAQKYIHFYQETANCNNN